MEFSLLSLSHKLNEFFRHILIFFVALGFLPFQSQASLLCEGAFYNQFLERIQGVGGNEAPPSIPFSEIPVTAASLLDSSRSGYLPDRGGLWTYPATRGVIEIRKLIENGAKISRSMKSALKNAAEWQHQILWNARTEEVIDLCASVSRHQGSAPWLTEEVILAFKELALLGKIYSSAVVSKDGTILAADFGFIDGIHFQGVSAYRNADSAQSGGMGMLLELEGIVRAFVLGFRSIDVEVAVYAGTGRPKPDVTPVLWKDFFTTRLKDEMDPSTDPRGVGTGFLQREDNGVLRPYTSDLITVYQELQAKRNTSSPSLRFKDFVQVP